MPCDTLVGVVSTLLVFVCLQELRKQSVVKKQLELQRQKVSVLRREGVGVLASN